jgi:peptidoglycan/xylan/chitin deacetylase (PgdA/CDA1 family)
MQSHAFVSLTFDDGLRCQFEKALPVLSRCGLVGTFFLIANSDPTHESWNHRNEWWKIDWRDDDIVLLKRLLRDGHEIGSHSKTHDLAVMQMQPDAEAQESKTLIEEWIGAEVLSFCYPFYGSHSFLANAVRSAGYQYARGGGRPPRYGPGASYYAVQDPALDPLNVDCREVSQNEDVQSWIRPGCWHVLTFHAVGDGADGWKPITEDDFRRQMTELARLRDSGAVEVLTFKDCAARISGRAA